MRPGLLPDGLHLRLGLLPDGLRLCLSFLADGLRLRVGLLADGVQFVPRGELADAYRQGDVAADDGQYYQHADADDGDGGLVQGRFHFVLVGRRSALAGGRWSAL